MTITSSPTQEEQEEQQDARALIEEAKRHRRRRYQLIGACAAVALVLSGLLVGIFAGTGGTGRGAATGQAPRGPLSAPTSATLTVATRDADVTVTTRSSAPGCPWTWATSVGSIDFARSAIALRATASKSAYHLCTGATGTQTRQFGSVVYETLPPPSCHPRPRCSVNTSGTSPTTASRPWLELPADEQMGAANASAMLQTPFALVALRAFPSPATMGGTTTLHGERVREYEATVTLADVQTVVGDSAPEVHRALAGIISPAGSVPSSSAIPVSLKVWTDSLRRVVRLSLTQPFYMVNFRSGESSGSLQFAPGTYLPHEVPSDYPYKQGYMETTIDFYHYGSGSHPARPPTESVSRG